MPTPSKHSRHPILASLGDSIRKRRQTLKLSQEALAAKAGLDRSYFGQVERGENSVSLLPLMEIAKALNTTLTELMSDAGL